MVHILFPTSLSRVADLRRSSQRLVFLLSATRKTECCLHFIGLQILILGDRRFPKCHFGLLVPVLNYILLFIRITIPSYLGSRAVDVNAIGDDQLVAGISATSPYLFSFKFVPSFR